MVTLSQTLGYFLNHLVSSIQKRIYWISNYKRIHLQWSIITLKVCLIKRPYPVRIISFRCNLFNGGISDSDTQFTGNNMYRRDRVGDRHDVCVYINKDLYCRRSLNLEIQNMEDIWNKMSTNTFYRSPSSPYNTLVLVKRK